MSSNEIVMVFPFKQKAIMELSGVKDGHDSHLITRFEYPQESQRYKDLKSLIFICKYYY